MAGYRAIVSWEGSILYTSELQPTRLAAINEALQACPDYHSCYTEWYKGAGLGAGFYRRHHDIKARDTFPDNQYRAMCRSVA